MKNIENEQEKQSTFKRLFPYLLLFIAILSVSIAAPLVVVIHKYNVPSEVVAMYRTLFAGIGAIFFALINKDVKWIGKKTTLRRFHWIIIAGLLLAMHFATWFLSLKYVSVAISTTLVDTVPIFMAVFGFIFFREKVNWIGILGIVIAFFGGVFLAFATTEDTSKTNPGLGIIFALIGALTVTFYFLIGKKILQDSPLWPYFGLVNLVSGISLMIYCVIRNYSFSYPAIAFLFITLMAAGPSLIGHATYNYSLRRLPAFIVGTIIVAEPIGATILGIIFLGQIPHPITILYAVIILLGIVLTSLSQNLSIQLKRRRIIKTELDKEEKNVGE
ncbi:MAG: DMT family transporter [Candidatus Heimdallarchaeaceae archaeon]